MRVFFVELTIFGTFPVINAKIRSLNFTGTKKNFHKIAKLKTLCPHKCFKKFRYENSGNFHMKKKSTQHFRIKKEPLGFQNF